MAEIRIAAAYIRVSTDDQVEYSPAAQLRELRDYARQHSLVLDERYIYSDEGISGRSAEKRPGFMRMVSDAKNKPRPFDVILVHKFDRFARSREDSVVYKSILKKAGVDVISIKEPLAEGNYSGVMEAIYESFAEAYSINLGQEVRKGMTEKALRGEVQTSAAFGYRKEGKSIVPDETEAPYIAEIFQRYLNGDGFYRIARWMNSLGLRTHRGGKFENRTIEYIIRNPLYKGYVRWNPKHRMRRNYLDPDCIIAKGSHQALVSEEIWERAQKQALETKQRYKYHARPTYDRKHWLSGIVRCASCGSSLHYQYGYFKCRNYIHGTCPHSQHIRVDLLGAAYISRLQSDLLSSNILTPRLIQADSPNSNLEILKGKRNRLESKRVRLTEAYLAEAIDINEFKTLKESLNKEIDSLNSEITSIKSSPVPIDATAALRSLIRDTLDTLTSDKTSIEDKYIAANNITEHCTFDKSTRTLSITYRIYF